MKIVVGIGKLEREFVEGMLLKASNHAESSPFRGVFDAIARALETERARWNSRPRRLAAKSLRFPIEKLSSGNLLAFQVEMAAVQFALSHNDLPHGAAFVQALGLAAGETLIALGEKELRQSLN